MASDSGTYDQSTLLRRQKIAEAMLTGAIKPRKIEHWAQGLAQMGEAGLGGYWAKQADDDVKTQKGQDAAALALLLGGGSSPSTNPAPAAPQQSPAGGAPMVSEPMGNRVAQAMTTGKIYENDEPSPLDPPSGKDRDLAVRTMLAEAGNQGPTGLQAVGSVIRNRAVAGNYGGDTPAGVVTAKNQFEPWNTADGRSKMAAVDPNSPRYQQADQALTQAYAGNDPTNGAVNFIAPKAQAALGRATPAWAQGQGQDIGDHRFFGGKPNPVVEAMSSAPTQAPAQGGGILANASPQQIAAIRAGMSASEGSTARTIAQAMMTQLAKPQEYGFQSQPDGTILRTDPRSGTVAPIYQGATKPTFGVIGKDQDGKESYGFIDASKGTIKPVENPGGQSAKTTVTGPDGKEIPIPPGVDRKTFVKSVTDASADAATGKKTEVQAKSEKFGNKMELAESNLKDLEGEGTSRLSRATEGSDWLPGSASIGRSMQTDNYQKYVQARDNFITALLRDESGAAIGTTEFNRYEKELFPQPGDGKAVIEQKREARRIAIEGMKKAAGPGYKSPGISKPAETNIDALLEKYK